MKEFSRKHLPESIEYKNKVYVRGEKTTKSIIVKVLHPNLRGKTDLHGRFYVPSIHYFNPIIEENTTNEPLFCTIVNQSPRVVT